MVFEYLLSSQSVSNWDIDENFGHYGTIIKSDGKTIADGTFGGIVIIESNLRIFDTMHLSTKRINSGIFCNIVFVIFRSQTAVNQGNGNLYSALS